MRCLDSAISEGVGVRLTPANGVDYFYPVTGLQAMRCMLTAWHNIKVDLDGDALVSQRHIFNQICETKAITHLA